MGLIRWHDGFNSLVRIRWMEWRPKLVKYCAAERWPNENSSIGESQKEVERKKQNYSCSNVSLPISAASSHKIGRHKIISVFTKAMSTTTNVRGPSKNWLEKRIPSILLAPNGMHHFASTIWAHYRAHLVSPIFQACQEARSWVYLFLATNIHEEALFISPLLVRDIKKILRYLIRHHK